MHKLAILAVHDAKAGLPDREVQGAFEFDTVEQAELRALLWLLYCPNDIVMLINDLQKSLCRHCNEEIKENAGWVIHKYVHARTGAYTCFNTMLTKAEPKEEKR